MVVATDHARGRRHPTHYTHGTCTCHRSTHLQPTGCDTNMRLRSATRPVSEVGFRGRKASRQPAVGEEGRLRHVVHVLGCGHLTWLVVVKREIRGSERGGWSLHLRSGPVRPGPAPIPVRLSAHGTVIFLPLGTNMVATVPSMGLSFCPSHLRRLVPRHDLVQALRLV